MTVEFPALALILLFPALGVVFNLFFGVDVGTPPRSMSSVQA